jgi:predicted outer membrane repeat protein
MKKITKNLMLSLMCLFSIALQAETYNVSTVEEFRSALTESGNNGGDNTIKLAAGNYSTQADDNGTFKVVVWETGSLVIEGSSREEVVLTGENEDRILLFDFIEPLSEVYIKNISFENGMSTGSGAGISYTYDAWDVYFSVRNSRFFNNHASEGEGGAINMPRLSVYGTEFSDNSAQIHGGAIYTVLADVDSCLFERNSTTFLRTNFDYSGGGAIYARGIYNGANRITNSIFTANSSASMGGAIHWSTRNGGLISGNTFTSNLSDTNGGAISSSEGYGDAESRVNQLIINNKFVTNSSKSGGSAIHNRGAGVNLFIVQNVFENNNSELDQVGIYANQSGYGGDHPFVFASNLIRNSPLMLGYMNTKNFIHNNIFVDNEKDIISEVDQTVLYIYNNFLDISKLPDALIQESDNIFDGINLGFKDYANSDFKLTSDSGLIDVGTTNSKYPYDDVYFPTEDYTGLTARLSGASVDLGPYEFSSTRPAIIKFDVEGDRKVDQALLFVTEATASAGRTIASYEIDNGDGSFVFAGSEFSVSYTTSGQRSVQVKVTDDKGEWSAQSLTISIADLTLEEKIEVATETGRQDVINNPATYGLALASKIPAAREEQIAACLASPSSCGINIPNADIDGNGTQDALTDGLLILRYSFGLTGDSLISGVVAEDATRTTAEEIEAYLATLMPAL